MAHVKVVRRSMRPEEWTDLRFVWLQRGIYEEKFEITDLEIRDARQISEDQYEYYSDEYRPLKKDDIPDAVAKGVSLMGRNLKIVNPAQKKTKMFIAIGGKLKSL